MDQFSVDLKRKIKAGFLIFFLLEVCIFIFSFLLDLLVDYFLSFLLGITPKIHFFLDSIFLLIESLCQNVHTWFDHVKCCLKQVLFESFAPRVVSFIENVWFPPSFSSQTLHQTHQFSLDISTKLLINFLFPIIARDYSTLNSIFDVHNFQDV